MGLPSQPVTLTVEQIEELNQKLSNLRHDVNNNLSLILAAVEVIKHRPQMLERMMTTLFEQPPKITAIVSKFSEDFERTLGFSHDSKPPAS